MGVKVKELPKGSDRFWLIIHHNGRRKKKYCGTGKQGRKVAEQAASQISTLLKLPDADLKKLYQDKEKVITLLEYVKKQLVIIKKTRELATYESHRKNFKNHILPVLGSKALDEITRQMAKDFILAKIDDKKLASKYKRDDGKTLTVSTVHNIMRTARYIMNCAKEDGIIQTNPFEGMGKLLSLKKTKENIHPLNEREVPLFSQVVKRDYPEWYPFFLTAIRTGLRKGELICLKWEDLDFANRFIWVRRTLRRDGTVKDTTKTGKTRRVDMSIELTEVLRSLKFEKEQGNEQMEWLYSNSAGNRIDQSKISKILKECLIRAGLRVIRVHDLRHTYATLLIQNGASLAYIKDQMGHASIQTTVDVYGHLVPGANKHEVDKLDEILRKNAPQTHPTDIDSLPEIPQTLDNVRAGGESRTPDQLITNQLLCL